MRGLLSFMLISNLLCDGALASSARPSPSKLKPKSQPQASENRGVRGSKKSAPTKESSQNSSKKSEQPALETVPPPQPFDYGPDPDAPPKKASTEDLLAGPNAGLVTTHSSVLLGLQVLRNPGMNLQFPAVLGGAADVGFGLSPFTLYADQIYFWKLDMSSAWMRDSFVFHDLRGIFLLSLGGGIEAGVATGIRVLFGGQYSFPTLPVQVYGHVLALYHLANADHAGGASWGANLGARVML